MAEALPVQDGTIGHMQQTARRIAAVLLLGPEPDASYRDGACENCDELAPAEASP